MPDHLESWSSANGLPVAGNTGIQDQVFSSDAITMHDCKYSNLGKSPTEKNSAKRSLGKVDFKQMLTVGRCTQQSFPYPRFDAGIFTEAPQTQLHSFYFVSHAGVSKTGIMIYRQAGVVMMTRMIPMKTVLRRCEVSVKAWLCVEVPRPHWLCSKFVKKSPMPQRKIRIALFLGCCG